MNRKDDHIQYAYAQPTKTNDFDLIKFVHHAFPEINEGDIDLSVSMFQKRFPLPFYINAMTGGSEQAKTLNERFAMLAKHFKIPLATGSVSAAIKNPSLADTFTVIRKVNPDGFVIANVGAGQTVENAKKAIQLLNANALQIHVNAVQEVVMPEGDRDFSGWLSSIQKIKEHISVPLIVKEVGFGMSKKTIGQLLKIGVELIDVAGQGGTNFAVIENQRRNKAFSSFDDWGISTVQSLINAKNYPQAQIVASGGIRTPLDVVKSLALGAKIVGLSGYFLHLVKDHTHEEAVEKLNQFIEEMKMIMLVLGKKNILALKEAELMIPPSLSQSI
jgi:isopentenyl-diphosphate delta-isomerase